MCPRRRCEEIQRQRVWEQTDLVQSRPERHTEVRWPRCKAYRPEHSGLLRCRQRLRLRPQQNRGFWVYYCQRLDLSPKPQWPPTLCSWLPSLNNFSPSLSPFSSYLAAQIFGVPERQYVPFGHRQWWQLSPPRHRSSSQELEAFAFTALDVNTECSSLGFENDWRTVTNRYMTRDIVAAITLCGREERIAQ